MTAEERCDLTELSKTQCAHCKKADSPVFPAVYFGVCATCTRPIAVGQRIRDRGDGQYEHASH